MCLLLKSSKQNIRNISNKQCCTAKLKARSSQASIFIGPVNFFPEWELLNLTLPILHCRLDQAAFSDKSLPQGKYAERRDIFETTYFPIHPNLLVHLGSLKFGWKLSKACVLFFCRSVSQSFCPDLFLIIHLSSYSFILDHCNLPEQTQHQCCIFT